MLCEALVARESRNKKSLKGNRYISRSLFRNNAIEGTLFIYRVEAGKFPSVHHVSDQVMRVLGDDLYD